MTARAATDDGRGAHALDARYARQRVLRGFGVAGQQRLAGAHVLIVGVGGLGAPASMYLAAAGVGAMTLVDTDTVDASNLHRQLLFGTGDIGRAKLDAARDRLLDINPLVHLASRDTRLDAGNALELVAGHDIVIDATDNFPARYAINDACLTLGIPFIYGSVARFHGQVTVFAAPDGPCYRCLFPEPPAPGSVLSCAEEGVLGVVPGIIGLHQATEAIKLLTGIGSPLVGRLLLLDLLDNDSRIITISRLANCQGCGVRDTQRSTTTSTSPVNSNPTSFPTPIQQISAPELAARLAGEPAPILIDVREQWEYDIAHLPGSRLIPLSDLQMTVGSLDKSADYVVICHHGMRSEMTSQWLQAQGFTRVTNLAGGIEGWSLSVDPQLARY